MPTTIAELFAGIAPYHHDGEPCVILGTAKATFTGHYELCDEYPLADAVTWTTPFSTPPPEAAEAASKQAAKEIAEVEKQAKVNADLTFQKQKIAEEVRVSTRRNSLHTKGGYLDALESRIAELEQRLLALEHHESIR